MTKTLTTKALRALRDSLKSWQDGYDPVDDKEQYEMFVTAETAVGELLANREAQPVAGGSLECEDELNAALRLHRLKVEGHSQLSDSFRAGFKYARRTAPPAPADQKCECSSIDYCDSCMRKMSAQPAPAVPDISALTDLIVDRLIDCSAADDDSIADAETFVYNACRAAMLAQPVSQGYKLPDNVREALTLALQAMEFMGDTLNNIDAVCTEDVEYVTPAFAAVRGLLAAAPEGGNGA